MKIGIVGSRRRDTEEDFKYCETIFLKNYKNGDEIVSGGCYKGGDRFAEILAEKYQVPIKIYYAQWSLLGKSAGHARNTYIARDCDILLAVVAPDRTGGTEDTIKKTMKMGKTIVLINKDSIEVVDKEDNNEIKEDRSLLSKIL